MLDPEYLRDVPEDIAEYFDELKTRILKDIARRIAENDYMMTSTAEYQMHKLEELGVSMEEIERYISETLNITQDKVRDIIRDSAYRSVQKDNDMARAAGKESPHPDLTQAILSGIQSTNTEIRNICRSMASSANKAFEHALDQAYLSVSSGAFSFADAVKTAVNDLGKSGIHWIDYPTGAHRRADSAIRNALRTGINQTAARCQEQNLDEMDCNMLETTSHMGARPEHAVWQGKVFWRKTPVPEMENFYEATGYGTGAGLCGWNCQHNFFPNFDGKPSFEHFDEDANNRQYELEQKQRYNERKVREWKRRQAVNKAGGVDTTREAQKVREWQQRQTKFLKAYPDMKRNYAREMIEDKRFSRNPNLKEFYTTDDKYVKMKIRESVLSKKQYESAVVYDQKGNIILKKDGEKHEIEFTVDELKKMKGTIVTHNHPGNTTFSPDDIYMLRDWGLQELRAAIDKGSYVLRNNDKIAELPEFEEFEKEHSQLYSKYLLAYKKKYPDWENDKERMDRVVQNNVINRLVKKYGLLYSFEEDEK